MKYTEITDQNLVCAQLKIDAKCLPNTDGLPPEEAKDVINSLNFKRMIRAINSDEDGTIWEPNWYDKTQRKYQAWVEIEASADKPGGFAFSPSCYGRWNTVTDVGSRLCFRDPDRFRHALKYFENLFLEDYLILR